MRKEVLIAIACIVVVIGGIFAYQALKGTEEIIPPVDNSTPCESYRDIPLSKDFEISPGIVLDKAVAPIYFQFGSVIPGATIDTWTGDGRITIGKENICYIPGDPLWLLIYNGRDGATTFQLQVINAPREVNHCNITGLDYQRAPEGALVGVTIPQLVTVAAGSCQKIPLSIHLPNLSYPNLWEFRIKVTTLEISGQVTTGLEIRFFCSMR